MADAYDLASIIETKEDKKLPGKWQAIPSLLTRSLASIPEAVAC